MDQPGADIPAQRGPLPASRAMVAAGELAPDSAQELVAERLQGLWQSLRGYDPQADHFVLTRQALARRIDLLEPAQSLLLRKPTTAISHGGGLKLGRSGAWIKEHSSGPAGERSYSINVGSAERGTLLRDVRVFEFDSDGRLVSRLTLKKVGGGDGAEDARSR